MNTIILLLQQQYNNKNNTNKKKMEKKTNSNILNTKTFVFNCVIHQPWYIMYPGIIIPAYIFMVT